MNGIVNENSHESLTFRQNDSVGLIDNSSEENTSFQDLEDYLFRRKYLFFLSNVDCFTTIYE
jgi:hypothetical protein